MKKIVIPVLVALCANAYCDVRLPAIFSDHAVLQKSKSTVIFGEALPDEKVTVSYRDMTSSTVTGKDGRWQVSLDLSKCDGSSHTLVVKGNNTVVSNDVITGDVWLCAGQSNMRFTMRNVLDAKTHIKNSANNKIRNFIVQNPMPFANGPRGVRPPSFAVGKWEIASAKTTASFSAVGYFFAKEINQATGKAIGLVDPSIGASSIESWLNRKTLLNELSAAVAKETKQREVDYENYPAVSGEYVKKYLKWAERCGRKDTHARNTIQQLAWGKPEELKSSHGGNGVFWFKKKINIRKEDIVNRYVRVKMGYPNTPAMLFIDGKNAGVFSLEQATARVEFKVSVPESIAYAGEHELALRFYVPENSFLISTSVTTGGSRVNNRNWQSATEKTFPVLTAEALKTKPEKIKSKATPQTLPGRIYDRKLYPLLPLTMKGTLWYQGEANADETRFLYGEMLNRLVKQLRAEFRNPAMPFIAVQLTSFHNKSAEPDDAGFWSEVRAQQSRVVMENKNVFETATYDLGEAKDVHPIEKQNVGKRLALIALANCYGQKDIKWQCPRAVSAIKQKNKVIVTFTGTYGRLKAEKLPEFYWLNRTNDKKSTLEINRPSSKLQGFALCNRDGKWFWADAEIKGDTVIVSNPELSDPVKIRYAWQDNPTANLTNESGLPAFPFTFEIKE